MFEKEAKEYCNKLIQNKIVKVKSIYDIEVMQKDLEQLFQYAAEFGYNKSKWHNIKENPNDLPKKEKLGQTFVVAFAFNEQTQKYYSFDCAEYIDKGKFVTHTFDVNNDNNAYKIIAWCEIPTFTNKGKV